MDKKIILVIDRDKAFREILGLLLSAYGHTVVRVGSKEDAFRIIDAHDKIHVIIAEYENGGKEVREIFEYSHYRQLGYLLRMVMCNDSSGSLDTVKKNTESEVVVTKEDMHSGLVEAELIRARGSTPLPLSPKVPTRKRKPVKSKG
jgi:CheY-like chemotaxis protein